MRPGRHSLAAAAIAAAALIGCGSREAVRGREESAFGAVAQQGDVAASAEADRLGTRREAQIQLDSARASLAGARPAAASSHLSAAAGFARSAAASADPPVADSLLAVAGDLNLLAADAGAGRLVTARDLARASGRLNLVEARRHHGLARAAAALRDWPAAGDNLIMTADHVERATLDLRDTVPPFVQQQARAARRLGVALLRRDAHAPAKVPTMLRTLDNELRRLERAAGG